MLLGIKQWNSSRNLHPTIIKCINNSFLLFKVQDISVLAGPAVVK